MRAKSVLCYLLPVVLGLASITGRATELDQERADEVLAQLESNTEELWRTVPWKTRLLDAQHTAVKERKPIFIWAMDGHPLGCT